MRKGRMDRFIITRTTRTIIATVATTATVMTIVTLVITIKNISMTTAMNITTYPLDTFFE